MLANRAHAGSGARREPRKACELLEGRAIQIYKSKLPSYELLGSDLEGLRATRKRSGGLRATRKRSGAPASEEGRTI